MEMKERCVTGHFQILNNDLIEPIGKETPTASSIKRIE